MIDIIITCDNCENELDVDSGKHDGYETNYAKTEIVILTCDCGKKYRYWTDGSVMFDYKEDEE